MKLAEKDVLSFMGFYRNFLPIKIKCQKASNQHPSPGLTPFLISLSPKDLSYKVPFGSEELDASLQ